MSAGAGQVASLEGVGVTRQGRAILGPVDLAVDEREHLAVLGPNGAGKTTLLRLLSTYLHPTTGSVSVLGARFGRVDLRTLRHRIGVVTVAMEHLLAATFPAGELVAAARRGATRPVPEVSADDRDRAQAALARVGSAHLSLRECRTLSQGEWQRVKIARALVTEPDLLLLDEPFAGLDLGGREALVADLDDLLATPAAPTVVMVTHHLEELPVGVRAALLLREGQAVAAGEVTAALTDETVSATFGVPVEVDRVAGRFSARVRRRPTSVPGAPPAS